VPELPDAEGFRRTFALRAEGKRVHGVRAIDRGMLRNSTPAGLGRALSGRRFASARRHGKLLVCPTDGPALLLHFGMTGSFVWSGNDHRHDRLVLELDDGDLHYRNMRRLGGIWLAKSDRELAQIARTQRGRSARPAQPRGAVRARPKEKDFGPNENVEEGAGRGTHRAA
jgi:formamidopyrimidine-DNA glycosylase